MSSYRNRRRAEANQARVEADQARRAASSIARVEANRANAQLSTGPRTAEGKAAVSTNATKHGLTAKLARLDPRDSPAYQQNLADLTTGLAPANPVEELLIRDLAMLKARLERIEAAEYAILMSDMDGTNSGEATAYLATAPQLATLEKTERFLRRNYMQTWSRLERMQRERKKLERELAENQPVESSEDATAKTTKQTQPAPTNSKHDTHHPPAATPIQPTVNRGLPTDEITATAA